jgi:hypothetical protein
MALTFSHDIKRIAVPQTDAQPLLIQSLINAIRDEEASERGICYDQIADAAGKDTLASGVQVGITLSLRSSWALEFDPGAYQATITGGNLADALARIYNTGNPQVLINSSAAATLVEGGVGGGGGLTAAQVWSYSTRELTSAAPPTAAQVWAHPTRELTSAAPPTAAQNASAVWGMTLESALSAAEIVRLMNAALTGDATGLEGTNQAFKSVDGTKTRVAGTVNAGTRTVTTRDGS